MPFGRNSQGRPEGTEETKQGVVHYTCNAPKKSILRLLGISAIGRMFGVPDNEVLLIPKEILEGRNIDTASVEAYLAKQYRNK